jgi:hypothetical protein
LLAVSLTRSKGKPGNEGGETEGIGETVLDWGRTTTPKQDSPPEQQTASRVRCRLEGSNLPFSAPAW